MNRTPSLDEELSVVYEAYKNEEEEEREYWDALEQKRIYEHLKERLLADQEILDEMAPTEEEIKEKFGDDYL